MTPISIGPTDCVFVLTGAGISAESGLPTFRASDGLWAGHRIEDVCTPESLHRNPALVWEFYSARRASAQAAQPNPAHFALAQLEARLGERFFLCTQNVDDLHERAGSLRVLHIHGELAKSRCEQECGHPPIMDHSVYPTLDAVARCQTCGARLRPQIVFFGETPLGMERVQQEIDRATLMLVIGTSGSVYPAANFVHWARTRGARTVYVGPEPPLNASAFTSVVEGNAGEVLPNSSPFQARGSLKPHQRLPAVPRIQSIVDNENRGQDSPLSGTEQPDLDESAPPESPAIEEQRIEGRASHAWRALRHRNFQLFVGGQSISLIGTWMTRVATGWLIYRLTGSALLLGTVSFAGQIPTFLLAPFAGVWVDRLNRRHVLVWTQTLAMVQSLLLAALTLSGRVTVPWVLALSAVQGIINAFDMPGRQAFLVQMVEDRRDLGNAIALNSSMVNMARLIGPSLAGLVIAASSEGWCFLIDGISYLAVIASLLMMRIHVPEIKPSSASMLTGLKQGWTYVAHFVPIRTILSLFALVSLMGMPFVVLMPIFAARVLHGGPHTLGFLMGAMGTGALVSALNLAARKSVLGLGRVIAISATTFGVGLIGFGLSHWFWLSMATMLVAGFGMMQGMAASNTIIQTIVTEDMRGRVMSYYTIAFVGMSPFGSLLAGSMAHAVGAPRTVILTGAVVLLGAAWFATRLPAVRQGIRPIYRELGILPAHVASGMESSSAS